MQRGNPPTATVTVTHAAYFLKNCVVENPSLSCSLICAGYDHVLQRGVIYSISPGGTLMEEPLYAVGGSGSTYILGHLDNTLNEKRQQQQQQQYHHQQQQEYYFMEEMEAVEFVKQSVQLAMSRDGSSGGFVRLYVIDQHGKREILPKGSGSQGGGGGNHGPTFISSSRRKRKSKGRSSASLEHFADVSPTF